MERDLTNERMENIKVDEMLEELEMLYGQSDDQMTV